MEGLTDYHRQVGLQRTELPLERPGYEEPKGLSRQPNSSESDERASETNEGRRCGFQAFSLNG